MRCITCHREHKPEITHAMDVTLPDDFCLYCHEDIGKEQASHKPFNFQSCATSGCHNYHDNTALYEDFLSSTAMSRGP
jgi:predicted CXXCH cytochrome family protein